MISSWRFFFVTLSLLYLGWPIESEKKVLTHFNVCLLLSFFLHGALKLEGFQRIRDFNAREVIMLVVQIKYKMEVDACNEFFFPEKKNQFWRGPLAGLCLGPRLRSVKIGKLQFIFKIITKRKCIHFQAILWSVPSAAFFLLHPSSSC